MKIGISTATFFGREVTENTFDIIRKLGIDTVEVFLNTFSEYEPAFTDMLADRTGGLNVFSVHTLNNHFEPELFNVVERTRNDAVSIFKKVLYGAKRLNAHYYTFHGPSRLKIMEYKINYANLGAKLTYLIQDAAEYGVNISYENVSWAFYNKADFMANLRPYAPSVKSCLDIKQAMQAGVPWQDFLKDMGDTLSHVHLCDYDASGRLCAPGKGIFDFKSLFAALKESGFDGPLMIELYSGDYSCYDDLARSRDYLLQCQSDISNH